MQAESPHLRTRSGRAGRQVKTCPVACILLLFLSTLALTQQPARAAEERSNSLFQVGFSSSMFSDVNENDAKAAIKVWGQLIAKERNVPTDPEAKILHNMTELKESLRNKKVDVVGLTTLEYDQLRQEIAFENMFVGAGSQGYTETYLLLAHQSSAITNLSGLRGRSLNIHVNPRTCLAVLWLDSLLAGQSLPVADRLAGKINSETKVSKVVLPVFFKQVDACLVTRSSFNTMVELNPQLEKQLIVLAESPAVVPSIFIFQSTYNSTVKEQILDGLRDLHKTPAGQQVLTIFHFATVQEKPLSSLNSSLELIAAHTRLCTETNAANTPKGIAKTILEKDAL
jgi:ABC-type phosphate/phosphonate transport system substrate-binding protein